MSLGGEPVWCGVLAETVALRRVDQALVKSLEHADLDIAHAKARGLSGVLRRFNWFRHLLPDTATPLAGTLCHVLQTPDSGDACARGGDGKGIGAGALQGIPGRGGPDAGVEKVPAEEPAAQHWIRLILVLGYTLTGGGRVSEEWA